MPKIICRLFVVAAPAENGYTFTSWSSENPLGKYAVGATVSLTNDAVFTANYSVNNYKVTLNSNSSANATVTGFSSAADVGKLVTL